MKQIFYILLFLTACGTEHEPQEPATAPENQLHIHFQEGFYQDSVILFRGNKQVYAQQLTTDAEKGYADVYSMPRDSSALPLRFRFVHDSSVVEGTIPVDTKQYIGFYITAGTAVNIYSTETPFSYTQQQVKHPLP